MNRKTTPSLYCSLTSSDTKSFLDGLQLDLRILQGTFENFAWGLVLDYEVVQQGLVLILASQAGVGEVAVDVTPFA